MKNMVRFIFGLLCAALIMSTSSCLYQNAQDAYPCVTGTVSFSKDVEPILAANCYLCHSQANAFSSGQGYRLDAYSFDSLYASPASGDILYGNIADPNISDVSHMPKNAASLSPCDIATIKTWIDQGYKNN